MVIRMKTNGYMYLAYPYVYIRITSDDYIDVFRFGNLPRSVEWSMNMQRHQALQLVLQRCLWILQGCVYKTLLFKNKIKLIWQRSMLILQACLFEEMLFLLPTHRPFSSFTAIYLNEENMWIGFNK